MKPQQITLFSASAGSGKTYTLTIEYIKMALSEVESKGYFRRILAVTFTIKAAEEMRQRILQFLAGMADYPTFTYTSSAEQSKVLAILDKVQSELAEDGIHLTKEQLAERAGTTLQQILQDYGLFSVMTIDSFVQRLSASFIDELNLPSQYEVVLDSNGLIHELINRLLDQVNSTGDAELSELILSFANQEIAEGRNWNRMRDSLHGFLKISLEEKFLAIEPNLSLFQVSDFLRLEDQLRGLLQQMLQEVKGAAESFIRIIDSLGLPDAFYYYGGTGPVGNMRSFLRNPEIADKAYANFKKAIEANMWTSAKATGADKAIIEQHAAELGDLGSQFIDLQSLYVKRYRFLHWVLKDLKKLALLNLIQREMRVYQQENSAIPISEFSKRVYEVISQDPIPFIYEKLGDRYFHIFIDEFQDTSILQWKNFMPLVENATSVGKRSLLVGDAKQSIYKFRGGEVSLIASLATQDVSLVSDHFVADSLDEQRFDYLLNQIGPKALNDNYRSATEIVEFNNRFYHSLVENESVLTLCHLIEPLYGANLKQNPKVASSDFNGKVDLIVYHKSQENFGFTEPENEFMFEQVMNLIRHNRHIGFRYADIAILARKNKHARYLALRLKEEGIPVISSDSLLVHYSPVVGFILSFLALKEHPKESLYLYEVIYQYAEIKGQEVSALDLTYLEELAGDAFEKAEQYFLSKGMEVPAFSDLLRWVYDVVAAFDLLIDSTGQEYVWKFLDILNEYVLLKDKLVAGFLLHFNLNRNSYCITSSNQADAVTISSIHKSKGLEYPVVILPFVNWTFQADSEKIWYEMGEEESEDLGMGEIARLKHIYGRVTSSEVLAFPTLALQTKKEKEAIFLDALNMLYVATTRPKQSLHLLLTVPEPDMHTKTISTYTNSVGRLVYDYAQTLSESTELPLYLKTETDWKTAYFTFSNESVIPSLTHDVTFDLEKKVQIRLGGVNAPVSLRVNSAKSDLYTSASKKREIGNQLHDLLAQLPDMEAWSQVRAKSKVDVSSLDALFESQQVRDFFVKDILAFKEVDLLCPDGKIIRPDRVNKIGEALQVIDFKTGKQKPEHQGQIQRYKQTLVEMGYQVTQGVLIYIETKELVYV
ncbi:UvrD-helicase domain-containing protein [Aquirufa antheringensis]|uniref:UvrD-helicase domain-containing protein n=1 Tax=Aquirufa antheringensis TaxID=2516559 RepID=UPI00208FB4EC|nr:UvrD-helicase domain-containing protein [Aquirufa antheringensis]USQ04539.1 UvrD-helicase domain-containing protein [Aquirufa antheringensis]